MDYGAPRNAPSLVFANHFIESTTGSNRILSSYCIQAEWTVSDVLDFLETCRMKLGAKVDQYKQIFVENDVDGEVLADMSDDQLLRSCSTQRPPVDSNSEPRCVPQAGNSKLRAPPLHPQEAAAPQAGVERAGFGRRRRDGPPGAVQLRQQLLAGQRQQRRQRRRRRPAGAGAGRLGLQELQPAGRFLLQGVAAGWVWNEPGAQAHLVCLDSCGLSPPPAAAAVPRLHQPTPRIHESKVTVG